MYRLRTASGRTVRGLSPPEGKFKVRSGTSSIETVIKSDEVLELRWRQNRIHVLRRPRVDDPEDLPRDPNTYYLGDDVT